MNLEASFLAAFLDGSPLADGRLSVHVLSPVFQHGEGLFETLPVLGGVPVFLERHLQRMARSAHELRLGEPPSIEVWECDFRNLMEVVPEGAGDLVLRLFFFRGREGMRRLVAATPLEKGLDAPCSLGTAAPPFQGVRPLARHKTMNYLVPRLALQEGMERGCDEVVFLMDDGTVLEGSRSTVFVVRDGVASTPPHDLPILPGVTREVLLEVARETGVPVREEVFTLADLEQADEVFLTSSLRGVRPVKRLPGGRTLPAPGPLTEALGAGYRRRL